MIGDNEDSDILGAHNSKWDSILVKTGVSKHDSKMATINSENIKEGVLKYL
jgi:ribonucleotide monophosphatase NagD (HAD superfamily)